MTADEAALLAALQGEGSAVRINSKGISAVKRRPRDTADGKTASLEGINSTISTVQIDWQMH